MSQWNTPYTLLREELRQRCDEGATIPYTLRTRIDALDPVRDAWNESVVWGLYNELDALASDPLIAEREPNELDEIRVLRPNGPRTLSWTPTETELVERLHGAWTGRAVGCALGKPVELIGVRDPNGRATIKRYLTGRNDWPLSNYFSGIDVGDGIELWCPASTRERIAYMEPDDDIHYSLAGLAIIEQHGPDFTWSDVAQWWMSHIPVSDICTAEAQALLNWMNRTARWGSDGGARSAATAAFCRRFRNPYREWIGAQIRSDGWAWVCAGKPELAAEFAYRDACWTHERNGIYGAMFFAAMQAAAFVVHDAAQLVEIGLSEIPSEARLAVVIRRTLDVCAASKDWESAIGEIEKLADELSPPQMSGVHTINNAAICVAALVFGEMDTLRTPAIAVMAGKDTDCNGASVGSIVGAISGRAAFDATLASQLHDTIRPNIIGFSEITMTELAQRTATQWHRVAEWTPSRSTP
jgi:ADP-ribosylglycohydrolase